MNAYPTAKPALAPDLAELIARHGRLRLTVLLFRALMRPPARPPDAAALPDHLRRDIGLPDLPPAGHRLWLRR